MSVDRYTSIQLAAMGRRLAAAENLERARQVIREHARYGIPVTDTHRAAVVTAELDYDLETTQAGWAVVQR